MDVRDNTTLRDDDVTEQFAEFLIVSTHIINIRSDAIGVGNGS